MSTMDREANKQEPTSSSAMDHKASPDIQTDGSRENPIAEVQLRPQREADFKDYMVTSLIITPEN